MISIFFNFFWFKFFFNKNIVKNNAIFESIEVSYVERPIGFLMIGLVLMFIAILFQIGGFNSKNKIFTVLFIFLILSSLNDLALSFKLLARHDGGDCVMKKNIRPLLPLVVF